MIVLMGIGLVGSHFVFLMGVAKLCSVLFPTGGLTIFLVVAVLSGFGMMNIQTRLERHFIKKHIKKRPNSGWRVVSRDINSSSAAQARWQRAKNAGRA